MTETIASPAQRAARSAASGRGSVILAGALAAIGAGALGMLACLSIVVLGWATDPQSSGTSPGLLRAAGHLWLLAHRAPLVLASGTIAIAPLGLTAVIAVLLVRAAEGAGRRTRSRGRREAIAAALSIAVPYALVVAVGATASRTPEVGTLPGRALISGFVLAALAALVGAARRVGWQEISGDWPAAARAVPAAVLVAVVALLATGAALVAAALIADVSRVSELARSVQAAGPAGFALLVLQLALAPNAAMWGAAHAAGTGFAIGIGTQVGPAGVTLGSVPALPLLAALPISGPAPAAAALATVGVVAAGLLAGAVLARRLGPGLAHQAPLWMALTALTTGAVFAALCWVSGGSGPGRLAVLGPDPLLSGAAVAQWLALAGVPAAWVVSWRQARSSESPRVIAGE